MAAKFGLIVVNGKLINLSKLKIYKNAREKAPRGENFHSLFCFFL